MEKKTETAVIACTVKVSVAGNSLEEVEQLIKKIREACTGDHTLEVYFHGDFVRN